MEIRVLGCSGGVGAHLRTTTILLDQDVLIDAGTGVGDLSIDEMSAIRHIFLTHSHLDHIACVPLLVDTLFDRLRTPITVHAQEVTLNALRQHIFNNVIWPDFTRLPTAEKPVLRFETMHPGDIVTLGDRRIESIPVNHIVPGVGYRIETTGGVFAFSGDTTTNDSFWQVLNARDRLDILMVEAAFPNEESDLCRRSGHYCPQMLAADLTKLQHKPQVYISHNKPGAEQKIFAQCQQAIHSHDIHPLTGGVRFTL
ncbi:MAG: MBL fold metallo-hydrolase [Gammaproteobacteria bacterium]|nr:MBL fold metallo-hydrolase [Gammaproteobacteria bacterium]